MCVCVSVYIQYINLQGAAQLLWIYSMTLKVITLL